jgi:hypothetical protein
MDEPPLYFPMRRLSASQFSAITQLAEESTPLLTTPLDQLPRVEVSQSVSWRTHLPVAQPPS